jgi:DnaJ-class molecular chaperone
MEEKKCSLCGGSGQVPAVGAWVTEYDSDTCPHCKGSGEEPLIGPNDGDLEGELW